MVFQYLRLSLFWALTIFSSVNCEELESVCGKTSMEVSNKSFSFAWEITGFINRLNDSSMFKLTSDKIIFKEEDSEVWSFNIVKRAHGVVAITAMAAPIDVSLASNNPFPTFYTITPEIFIEDKVIQLETIITPTGPTYSNTQSHFFGNTHAFFNRAAKKINKFSKKMHQSFQQHAEQQRVKRMAANAEVPQHVVPTPGYFANNAFAKYATWHNIFPQLHGMLAQMENPKDMKIKFSIQATISKNEYSTVECKK